MTRTITFFILKLLILILLQVVIFNNIVLFNVAMPFVFIYALITMPITWSTNASLTIAFFTGLIIDIFSNTLGVNALACTLLAFVRKPVFHLYEQRDEDLGGHKPSQTTMGSGAFLKYGATMSLIYCLAVFTIDAFAIFNPIRWVEQVVGSAIFTFIIIYALDSIFTRQHEKRL
ncbi:MAG: rod shape-determining protein MreD [Bacteroidales bacterium]|nr:rod shape-determining protein MreD [Bacteroidales bacterium]